MRFFGLDAITVSNAIITSVRGRKEEIGEEIEWVCGKYWNLISLFNIHTNCFHSIHIYSLQMYIEMGNMPKKRNYNQ